MLRERLREGTIVVGQTVEHRRQPVARPDGRGGGAVAVPGCGQRVVVREVDQVGAFDAVVDRLGGRLGRRHRAGEIPGGQQDGAFERQQAGFEVSQVAVAGQRERLGDDVVRGQRRALGQADLGPPLEQLAGRPRVVADARQRERTIDLGVRHVVAASAERHGGGRVAADGLETDIAHGREVPQRGVQFVAGAVVVSEDRVAHEAEVQADGRLPASVVQIGEHGRRIRVHREGLTHPATAVQDVAVVDEVHPSPRRNPMVRQRSMARA